MFSLLYLVASYACWSLMARFYRLRVEISKGYWISSHAANRANYRFLSQIQRQTPPLRVRIAENID